MNDERRHEVFSLSGGWDDVLLGSLHDVYLSLAVSMNREGATREDSLARVLLAVCKVNQELRDQAVEHLERNAWPMIQVNGPISLPKRPWYRRWPFAKRAPAK